MSGSSFLERLSLSWPPDQWREVTVLLAVSGGADSVALLTGMAALKHSGEGRLIAAHFNHRTRGAASDEDEAFVRRLAQRWGIECRVGQAEDAAALAVAPDGFEAAAREARYAFLRRAAQEAGARFVAVAHTADDQAETVLHRILRGTGVAGLAGIPRTRVLAPGVTLIRPLLAFRRQELRAFLEARGQTWREDASNAILDRTRNRIRGELLPRLAREYNPAVVEALLRLSNQAREAHQVIHREAEALLERCLVRALPDEVHLDAAPLERRPEHLLCEMFLALWRRQHWPRQRMGQTEWRRLAALATERGPGRKAITLSGNIVARILPDRLILTRCAE